MEDQFNLFYYVNIYKRSWKTIALVVIISLFLAMGYTLRKPPVYVSTVTILSIGGETSTGSLSRFLGLPGLSSGGASSYDIIIAVVHSRRMSKDIRERFELDKRPEFSYSLRVYSIRSCVALDVKGGDPVLTEQIANFAVENLDKINAELDITPNKPMVKVLDPAIYGCRVPREISRKMLIAGLLSFLLSSCYVFFSDYLGRLKSQHLTKISSP